MKMKKKRMLFLPIMLFLMLMPIVKIEAKTLQDMYDQLADLQIKYNNSKNNAKLTQEQINSLNKEISNTESAIEQIRKEIKVAEADIDKSKETIESKKVETDGLIQFLQVSNGGNIYLEYLFDAENYTDFIYRYEVVKQLTNYNSDLIDELEKLIVDLQKKEKELSEKNIKLEASRKELTQKVNTLSYSLTNFQSEGVDLAEDIENLKSVIQVYVDMGCSRNQDIATCSTSINAYGWRYPLAKGCVTSEFTTSIRNDWSGGGAHYAIDLDCVSEGTPIYAAADGVIARIANYETCGGNALYITHTVNGKKYTTVYMHLLRYADSTYVGKVVTDKTVIGYVGGWSTSAAHGGKDKCTTGTHLHFGIAEGHNPWNFNPYAINPREIFAFPKLVYNGGGYFYR